ncbi:diguanylate cyclase [Solibacillus sp. CAU 1738]|uniref:diguanylate cyclase n=1 Tax=Solibacillus sp. CAU 1738 TaxID=3140363 RepID=UPI0032604803
MIIDLLVDFCILFTFTVLIYWLYLYYFNKNDRFPILKPILIGIAFGVNGIILMTISFPIAYGIIINARIIPLLFSGLLGGPIAVLVSGLIMFISRFFLPDIYNFTLALNINFLLIVIIIAYIGYFFEFTYNNIFKYFWVITLEIVLLIFHHFSLTFDITAHAVVTIYIMFSCTAFYIIFIAINHIKYSSEQLHSTNYLMYRDFMTQLPNNIAIEKQINYLLSKKKSFHILYIDINQFKHINLNYGSTIGDEVLVQMGQLLTKYAQKNGAFAGRSGGEEFIVIIHELAPAYAIYEAHNINKLIATHTFTTSRETTLHITTSISIVSAPDNGTDIKTLIQKGTETHCHMEMGRNNVLHANNLSMD